MKILIGIVVLGLVGCSSGTVKAVGSGSHTKQAPWGNKTDWYVVWADDPQIREYLTSKLLHRGFHVVEQSRLDAVLAEQRIILPHPSGREIFKIGRLVGATNVVFADTHVVPPRSGYESQGYEVSATVRNVVIETGEVKWSGKGTYAERVSQPQHAALFAVSTAYIYATCPTEDGYAVVPGKDDSVWCVKKP
jgi:hypothetical protein